ncbi:TetR family transcriptional regulator [Streptomyces sp. ISL-12]|uniref:TetR/AcrR family transcriptional regulator n=1 Tax=Streptomyces sp. ISL-12 TaxID=2819177 RepID=UPI001BE7B2F9|nr:TetR family transcriptional regulator [Streptomyces sp. ISL-12]MBT2415035.1 TetR family transcriptional regulator [Streptomyces sp. ISL-12]
MATPTSGSSAVDSAADRTLPLRERKKQRTFRSLADVALTRFTERGFDEVTLDELVDEVEISKRTFFRYYSSKESVALAAEAELWIAYVDEFTATDLHGDVLTALRTALTTAITGMDEDWPRRFLATRRLAAGHSGLRRHSLVMASHHQEQIVEQLEAKLGRDGREDIRLRLLGEIAFGAYRVGAKNWTAGRGKGAGQRGKGGRATLAARVSEAFDTIPDAITLTTG